MSDSRYDRMIANSKRFFETEECPDFSIRCQGKERKVHHFILCGPLEALAKICNGSFQVLCLPIAWISLTLHFHAKRLQGAPSGERRTLP